MLEGSHHVSPGHELQTGVQGSNKAYTHNHLAAQFMQKLKLGADF